MFESLYARLVALMFAILAFVGILQVLLFSHYAQLYSQEVTQDVNRNVARQIASRRETVAGHAFNRAALERLFSDLMTTHPSIEVYALDVQGKLVLFSAPPQSVVRETVSLEPVRRFLSGEPLPIFGDDPRDRQGRRVFSVAPVRASTAADAAIAGYIYVVLEGQPYQSTVQRLEGSYILRQGAWVAGATFVVALVAALLLLKHLTARLRRLALTMQTFEASGFSQIAPAIIDDTSKVDEIDRLQRSFGVMATRITEQLEQIRHVDRTRRDLIANLSHDLRTPLASLRGYIETVLLKEPQLTAQQRHQFLSIAADRGEQLGKLIEDLFDLSRLDSPDMALTLDPVSMAELAQDSLQKFRLAAEEKGVVLSARLEPGLPNVVVDVALMARVVDNILDNAIRHTPAGKKVEISVVGTRQGVGVCVADEGCGISPADLTRIFDRFFQARRPTHIADAAAHTRGAGLGLAIAQQIVARHGASLDVVSELGMGTRFSFELHSDATLPR